MRGNSVYFPDRVVPMLPERISNDLCSLREHEVRPCLVARMVFDKQGNKRGHTFMRALMRSAAKLSYQEAQAAIDGQPSEKCRPAAGARAAAAVGGLCGARRRPRPARAARPRPARAQDRARRQQGQVERVIVAAAARGASADRRVHDPGQRRRRRDAGGQARRRRLPRARRALQGEAGGAARVPGQPRAQAAGRRQRCGPATSTSVLQRAKTLPVTDLINEVVLRSQAQAVYAAENARPLRPAPAPLRAFHLADPPLRRPHRAPRADPRAGAGRRRAGRRGGRAACPRSPSRSRTPSAAPWRPSARPSTG